MKNLFPAAVSAHFLILVILLLPLLTIAGTIHSNLFIEPDKQFILGGDQRGAFKVAAKNVGTVPVAIITVYPVIYVVVDGICSAAELGMGPTDTGI